MLDALPFAEIWAVDFEFVAEPGENPEPVCLVARELRSGRTVRVWQDELRRMPRPPYPTGPEALFVAYYATAEIGCHLALGWPVPERVLDLFTEFRNRTNGVPTGNGAGLLGALAFFGLDGIGTAEKQQMRDLVLRGGPWSDAERKAILDYCQQRRRGAGAAVAEDAAGGRSAARPAARPIHGGGGADRTERRTDR